MIIIVISSRGRPHTTKHRRERPRESHSEGPDDKSTVDTTGAELLHPVRRTFKHPDGVDGVLVCRVESSVVLDLAPEVHLLEHVEGRLFPRAGPQTRTGLCLDAADHLPTGLAPPEPEGLAVVTGSDDLGLAVPDEARERQGLGRDAQHGARRRVRPAGVHDRDAAVVAGEGEGVAAGREGHGVDPAGRVVEVLAADGVEGEPLPPGAGLGAFVDALDEPGEDAGVGVGRARGEQDAVRVPRQGRHRAPDRLLQVLRDPPVVLLLKVAHGDQARPGPDGELPLRGGPAHERGRAVDPEEDEGRFPPGGGRFPHVGISICFWSRFSRQPDLFLLLEQTLPEMKIKTPHKKKVWQP